MSRKGNLRGKYPLSKKRALSNSVVVCPVCSTPYNIYRTIKKHRKYQEGHIKDLWCYVCKEERKCKQLSHDQAKYNYFG